MTTKLERAARGAALALAVTAALTATAAAQSLTGAGATFPYPIYSKWFDTYHRKTGVTINYQSIGSGAGIEQVRVGTVDFGASDAALSNERLKELPRPVLHFPTVAGAVVLPREKAPPGALIEVAPTPAITGATASGGVLANSIAPLVHVLRVRPYISTL